MGFMIFEKKNNCIRCLQKFKVVKLFSLKQLKYAKVVPFPFVKEFFEEVQGIPIDKPLYCETCLGDLSKIVNLAWDKWGIR